jgi:hypothetical protein
VKSRSWLVRTYYRNRIFMGVCCISCEVLYLSVSHLPIAITSKRSCSARHLCPIDQMSRPVDALPAAPPGDSPAPQLQQCHQFTRTVFLLAQLRSPPSTLQLYALDWKQFREWPVLPVALPQRLLRDLPDTAGLEKVPSANPPELLVHCRMGQQHHEATSSTGHYMMHLWSKELALLQGLPLAAVTAALSLPGFLVKQIINCFQLRSSMQVRYIRT